jgi:nucleoside-diphosphate-sugar epimerase
VTMRILVTGAAGAAGFLGSHLTDRLLSEAMPLSASTTSPPATPQTLPT